MGTRHTLAVAMVLALSRYDACACAGPSDGPPAEPTVPHPDHCDDGTTDALPAEPEGYGAGPSAARSIPYGLRTYRTAVGRRLGVRGPRHLDVVDDCEGDASCVLDGAWWRGPGAYVFWAASPAERKREAEVELVGDELEISWLGLDDALVVAHRIEGVELQVVEGPRHVLMVVNRTDDAVGVVQYLGAPFFDLVRTGADGWADAPVRPELDCGTGIESIRVAAASSAPLGTIEGGSSLLEGALDADTLALRVHERPDDRPRAHRSRDGTWVVHTSVATAPLPPELIQARARRHERRARRSERRARRREGR